VHPAKRVPCGVVIKFRYGANRGPACTGVAVLTRKGKRSVRTPARLPLRISRAHERKRQNYEDNKSTTNMNHSGNDDLLGLRVKLNRDAILCGCAATAFYEC